MKHFRERLNLKNISSRARVMLLFFVALPIMAVLGAGILNRLILMPVLSQDAKASENKTVETFSPQDEKLYSFYMLQAGAFTDSSNAESMADKIASSGFNAFTVKDGDVFKVVTAASSDKTSIDSTKGDLESAGYITMNKKFGQGESMEALSNEKKQYISSAGGLINLMIEQTSSGEASDAIDSFTENLTKQYGLLNEEDKGKAENLNTALVNGAAGYKESSGDVNRRMEIIYECVKSYGLLTESFN